MRPARAPRCGPGILSAVRLLVSRARAPQGPISPTYQQAGAKMKKRENHRSFLLLLFLAATTMVEFRYGAVVAFQFADASVKVGPWQQGHHIRLGASAPTSRARPLWLDLQPAQIYPITRAGNDVQPGLERFRHLKRGTTVPIPER